MHKAAMELGKKALEWANNTGINNISDQGWDNLKDCMEAVKNAICADKEYREIDEMDEMEKLYGRMGYRGRDSMGRFVHRSGRGRSAGYTPFWHMMPEMDDMYNEEYPEIYGNYRMGYTGGRAHDMNMGGDSVRGTGESSRYGRSYDNYKQAKRHYTETQSPEHQRQMKENISEIFDDMEDIVQDVWKDMEPAEKQKYKAKMTQLVQKMQ